MGWVEIMPAFAAFFRRHGMESAGSYLDWSGVLINHHRGRQVEQVRLASLAGASGSHRSFFIKKQSGVTWRERFRNAWAGFGWCATAVREGAILQALRRAGIACPEVAALGEDGERAFVVLREVAELADLRTVLLNLDAHGRCRLATALGRELARMHEAGFDHPDLFAKHVLAGPAEGSFRFCILDWQRGRKRRRVSWPIRIRDLAVLDATLMPIVASDRLRLRCLRAYRQATRDALPPGRLVRAIRQQAEKLLRKSRIREAAQLPTPAADQAFVPLRGGEIVAVKSFADRLGNYFGDMWIEKVHGAPQAWNLLVALASAAGVEQIQVQSAPDARPVPRLAHTLFRLQRFGVPVPRLLAAGDGMALLEIPRSVPLANALAKATLAERRSLLDSAGILVRRIHEAGYRLPLGDSWPRVVGVANGTVTLVHAESLEPCNLSWQRLAPVEFNAPSLGLSRTEQIRFLRGYLGRQGAATTERQAAA